MLNKIAKIHLVRNLTKATRNMGDHKKFVSMGDRVVGARRKTPKEQVDYMKEMVSESGTTSILDIPINLLRKAPGVKKVLPDDKYNNLLYSYQNKLLSADKNLGQKLVDKFPKAKKVFTNVDMVPNLNVSTKAGDTVTGFVPTEVARLSAPIDKTKKFGGPILGAIGVGSIVDSVKNPQDMEEGDHDMKKDATDAKELFLSKVAETILKVSYMQQLQEYHNSLLTKTAEASDLLKSASLHISSLEEELSSTLDELDQIKLQLIAKEKATKAVKLAKEMVSKNIIKKSEFDTEVDKIMEMSDDAYEVLKQTVSSVRLGSKEEEALDKISFIFHDDTSVKERRSLEEEILNISK